MNRIALYIFFLCSLATPIIIRPAPTTAATPLPPSSLPPPPTALPEAETIAPAATPKIPGEDQEGSKPQITKISDLTLQNLLPKGKDIGKQVFVARYPGQVLHVDAKYNLPPGMQVMTMESFASFTRHQTNISPPAVEEIFQNHPKVSSKLSDFMKSIPPTKDPIDTKTTKNKKKETTQAQQSNFLVYFKKIHFTALHELFEYFRKIYTNFNIVHPGVTRKNKNLITTNPTYTVSLDDFLKFEREHSVNRKTLIINHMTNIIESQINGAARNMLKNIDPSYASVVGRALMHNDTAAALDLLVHKSEESLDSDKYKKFHKKMLEDYFDALGKYLGFEEEYTSILDDKTDADPYKGIDEFYTIAAYLQEKFKNTSYEKTNPQLFFFAPETLKGIKVVPKIARHFDGKEFAPVDWAQHVVEIAKAGTPPIDPLTGEARDYPMAFFTDKYGNETTNYNAAVGLYMNVPIGGILYKQELYAEPNWFSSSTKIMSVLKACLGNFWAITGAEILDPLLEYLFTNAAFQYNKTHPDKLKNIHFGQTPPGSPTQEDVDAKHRQAKLYLKVLYGEDEKDEVKTVKGPSKADRQDTTIAKGKVSPPKKGTKPKFHLQESYDLPGL